MMGLQFPQTHEERKKSNSPRGKRGARPSRSTLFKGPKEISDEARARTPPPPGGPEHFLRALLPVGDMEVWGKTERGKRQPPHAPSLDHLETAAHVLVCRRKELEHRGPQNTAWALAGLSSRILNSSPSDLSEQPASQAPASGAGIFRKALFKLYMGSGPYHTSKGCAV